MTTRASRVVYLVALAFAGSPFFYGAFRAGERLVSAGTEPSHIVFVGALGVLRAGGALPLCGGIASAVGSQLERSRGGLLGAFAAASALAVLVCAAFFHDGARRRRDCPARSIRHLVI